eukprot:334857-Chlamydomonas_euryale.AAC.3
MPSKCTCLLRVDDLRVRHARQQALELCGLACVRVDENDPRVRHARPQAFERCGLTPARVDVNSPRLRHV